MPGSGKYLKSRLPSSKCGPIALDATLRASAPHQFGRRESGLAKPGEVKFMAHDLREKVLSRLTGASILFAVDASGSMGSEEVMGRAKSLILSLLSDVYQKRDRLALLSFRGTEAKLALPFTTSVELANKKLKDLPTGGKSPLALGLAKAIDLLKREIDKNPGRTPLLVLLTDGRANISMAGGDPFAEAMNQAGRIRQLKLKTLVVDTDMTWIDPFTYAPVLASAMGARCLSLNKLKAERVIEFIVS